MSAIRWEEVACNLCASGGATELFRSRDYRFLTDTTEFAVVRCHGCGLVRLNPRPIEADIHRYYHDAFYRSPETPAEALRNMQPRAETMARHVTRYGRGRLLDVGCFRGEFIEYLRATHGWDVAGVEFSQRPPNYYGLDIFYGALADAPFADASFDVITLWAVLEHVYDPSTTLGHVGRLLRPGGTAIVLVPNFNSIPARFMRHDDVPRHVTMFTRRTLGRMLRHHGLHPREWRCSQDICGGSVRGWLNFLVKRLNGEPMSDIQGQNRLEDALRWVEFSSQIYGRDSRFLRMVDRFDVWLAPRLDRVCDAIGAGFIMSVHAQKV